MELKELYDKDFYAWTMETANALKNGKLTMLDTEHLLEEIESMGASQKQALKSRLRMLLMHLLKWEYQPSYRSRSWENTITAQRDDLSDLIEDNPSLKNKIGDILPKSYRLSLLDFENETGISPKKNSIPSACPYSFEEIMNAKFYPENS